jgi:predicted nucleic acid-binding protein
MSDYWDTSCLLKLHCLEEDSRDYLTLLENADSPPVTSKFTATELYFALQQKARRGETQGKSPSALFAFFEYDLEANRVCLLPWGDDVFKKARELANLCYADAQTPVFLRSLDGIHLATAVLASCKRVHSSNDRMNQAIEKLGLRGTA